jgi:single-stranded-DNA-specific exonuclease
MDNNYNILYHYLDTISQDELLPTYWIFQQPSMIINNIKEKILLERSIERKIYTLNDIFEYLDTYIPSLPNINKAFETMKHLIDNNIPIGIIGDYDVDGICSTALIYTFFKRINYPAYFFIGDRQDGYGPTNKGFETLRQQGAKSFIVLDSGTVAKEILEQQSEPIIVIDHHIPDESHQPNNAIIINPQINNHPMMYCCTGGLVFAFIYGLKNIVNYEGNYDCLLAIAGITTVCDVMFLSPINSMYVQYTTYLITQNQCPSIFQFIIINKMTKKLSLFDEEDLGFFIGPHVNSIGRLCSNKYIHQLVEAIAQDILWPITKKKFPLIEEQEAYQIAFNDNNIKEFIEILCKNYFPNDITDEDKKSIEFIEYLGVLMMNLNVIRKQRQKILSEEINDSPIAININQQRKIFGFCSQLQESFLGIVGIIAAKVCENYYKPSFIGICLKEKIKGSIRSIDGVNVGLMMISAKEKKIIIDGGGHSKAGGFTVAKERWDEFLNFCNEFTIECLKANEKKRNIIIDYILSVHSINNNLLDDMKNLKPFGEGNPKLNFLLINCKLIRIMIIKQAHLMITIEKDNINYNKNSNLTAWIFFYQKQQKFIYLSELLQKNSSLLVDLVVNIGIDKSIYIIDFKINTIIPKNFLNNLKQ